MACCLTADGKMRVNFLLYRPLRHGRYMNKLLLSWFNILVILSLSRSLQTTAAYVPAGVYVQTLRSRPVFNDDSRQDHCDCGGSHSAAGEQS